MPQKFQRLSHWCYGPCLIVSLWFNTHLGRRFYLQHNSNEASLVITAVAPTGNALEEVATKQAKLIETILWTLPEVEVVTRRQTSRNWMNTAQG